MPFAGGKWSCEIYKMNFGNVTIEKGWKGNKLDRIIRNEIKCDTEIPRRTGILKKYLSKI